MQKTFFFDIDDTLCHLGQILPDNEALLRELKARGHRLAIATGRAAPMLPPDIERLRAEGLFDGFVCANGQYNFYGNQLLSHRPLELEANAALIELAQRFGLWYQQAGAEAIALSAPLPRYDAVASTYPCFIVDADFHRRAPVYQFSYFLPEHFDDAALREALRALDFQLIHWKHLGADAHPQAISKLQGIRDFCRLWRVDLSDVLAFGDGLNDMEMLAGVGCGIALGNAKEIVQRAAKMVSKRFDEGGIRHACQQLGLLD